MGLICFCFFDLVKIRSFAFSKSKNQITSNEYYEEKNTIVNVATNSWYNFYCLSRKYD